MMKRSIVSVVLCVLALTGMSAQDYPQYCFYLQPDLYTFFGVERPNDSDDYVRLSKLKVLLSQMYLLKAFPQYILLEHDIYDIECRSMLKYAAAGEIPFFLALEEAGTAVRHLTEDSDRGQWYSVYFRKPLAELDASVFTEGLKSLELPTKAVISYISSPNMSVANLRYLSGADVYKSLDESFLIDKNGILIAGVLYRSVDVMVPEHVKSLGAGCLRGAKDLTTVRCRSDVSVIGERALDVPSDLSLYLERATPVEIHPLAFGDEMPYRIFVPDKKLAKAYKKLYPQWKKVIKVDKSLVK